MNTPLSTTATLEPAAPAPVRTAGCDLIEPLTLSLPRLPAMLDGLTLLHVSDLHVRRPRKRFDDLLESLASHEVDLLLLTGDFMTTPGDEPAAEKFLRDLLAAARTRRGAFGVWGNHDSPDLRRRCADLDLQWLNNDAAALEGLPMTIFGVDCGVDECREPEGCLRTAMAGARLAVAAGAGAGAGAAISSPAGAHHEEAEEEEEDFRLLLAHVPTWLKPAAEADIGLMLAGHTHGGQIRLPFLGPLLNATPGWPLRLSSGLLRHRDTHAVVSRGVGESMLDGLRFLCPPHVPLITLRNGGHPGTPANPTPHCLTRW